MSVAVLERVRIIEVFFLKKMYENFVRTLETVRNGQVSVPRGSTVLFPSNLHVLIAEREVVIN